MFQPTELPTLTKPEEECSRSKIAVDYTGVMSTAFDGQQCLPWVFPPVIEVRFLVFLTFSRYLF